jgi:hypothetical protein
MGLVRFIERWILVSMPYISYTAAPEQWTLSSGKKPPFKKHFTECSYDPVTRAFCGSIDWSPDSFGHHKLWRYEMVFTPDFSTIYRGHNLTFRNVTDRDATQTNEFAVELFYCRQGLADNLGAPEH